MRVEKETITHVGLFIVTIIILIVVAVTYGIVQLIDYKIGVIGVIPPKISKHE